MSEITTLKEACEFLGVTPPQDWDTPHEWIQNYLVALTNKVFSEQQHLNYTCSNLQALEDKVEPWN